MSIRMILAALAIALIVVAIVATLAIRSSARSQNGAGRPATD